MKIIAVIPARSGSKGLIDKNIRELNGKPLLVYSIESAMESGIVDTIHVSTDSQEYAEIAKEFGADVPFLRDSHNAEDDSSSWDVVREVLEKYKSIGKEFDVCILLQPTSPFRTADDIVKAYNLFIESNARSLTSVTDVEHPVQWCFMLDSTCFLKDFSNSPYKYCRRQELIKYYHENGSIYIVRSADIIDSSFDFYTDRCVAYIMDRERSVDIDTLQDFLISELLMKLQLEDQK